MTHVTLWHNPHCSKSRSALKLLELSGHTVTVRRYLEDAPNPAEITAAADMLGLPLIDMVRRGEQAFRDASLRLKSDAGALLAAMAAHPILIERPIAFASGRAAIGRPPERVLDIL